MKVTVVGYLACDFKDKDGKQVRGVSLKVTTDSHNENLVGKDVAKIWLPESLVNDEGFIPDVGSKVELLYETDGRKLFLVGYKLLDQASDNES